MTNTISATAARTEHFRQRLAAVLKDLNASGIKDPEIVLNIGSLAAEIARALGKPSLSAAKTAMSQAQFEELHGSLMKRGGDLANAGQTKKAYAARVVLASLVAHTHRSDEHISEGERLLDVAIDKAIAQHRAAKTSAQ
jgi:hypothetical protein